MSAQAPRVKSGLSIAAKLVAVMSIVVAVVVGVAVAFGQRAVSETARTQIDARRIAGERAIARESALIAQAVAGAAALPVANNAYADVPPVLEAALANGEGRVVWLTVADTTGQPIAKAGPVPPVETLLELAKIESGQRLTDGKPEWMYRAGVMLGDRQVGTLQMQVSSAGLEAQLATELTAAADKAAATRRTLLIVAVAVLAAGIVVALLMGLSLSRPIRALTRQAQRIAGGDLHERVPATRRDELGALASSFNFMADQLGVLLQEQAQKASLEKEMDLARGVQQSMLPSTALAAHGAIKVAGWCEPASSCGGDWWTYRKLADGRLLVVLGDATGHGIHSAMIAASARGAVEALSSIDERLLTPEQVLRAIDASIRNVGDHNVLMTCFAALFDSTTGVLHYANAAQNFPYIVHIDAQRMLFDSQVLAASGNPLGDPAIKLEIRRGSLQLAPGDVFVMFSDGLVERANRAGKLFGDRRLRKALHGATLHDGAALVALRDSVLATAAAFSEGLPAEDDITFVLCQYDPAVARMSMRAGA